MGGPRRESHAAAGRARTRAARRRTVRGIVESRHERGLAFECVASRSVDSREHRLEARLAFRARARVRARRQGSARSFVRCRVCHPTVHASVVFLDTGLSAPRSGASSACRAVAIPGGGARAPATHHATAHHGDVGSRSRRGDRSRARRDAARGFKLATIKAVRTGLNAKLCGDPIAR